MAGPTDPTPAAMAGDAPSPFAMLAGLRYRQTRTLKPILAAIELLAAYQRVFEEFDVCARHDPAFAAYLSGACEDWRDAFSENDEAGGNAVMGALARIAGDLSDEIAAGIEQAAELAQTTGGR